MGASAFGSITALAATPPAPGVAQPSYLYTDLQSRALWLGVDLTVDPIGSVLISDIVQTQADIIAAEVNAKAYADAQVALRAPLEHTHTAAEIVDFNAAVDAAVASNAEIQWVTGMIMMWSGALSSIGVGPLAGWTLCDGSNGSPDLRDRFIIGAGNKVPGAKNELDSFKTDLQGTHTHTINGLALTLAQMPAHTHAIRVAGRQYGATYGGAGAHAHAIGASFIGSGTGSNGGYVKNVTAADIATTVAGAHDHSCYVDIDLSDTSDSKGSGSTHTHTENSTGAHQHTITSQQVRDNLPYYALAYIMKL